MIGAGVDAGSRTIKVVLVRADTLTVVGSGVTDQGIRQSERAMELLDRVVKQAEITHADIGCIVATGYGRDRLDAAQTTVTEITCHARGVWQTMPGARTVVDIGGQDSKLVRLDERGAVRDFVMNDRCAAGTGRFLEVVASRIEVSLNELGTLADETRSPCAISSMCVVFAETEIIGLLASGAPTADIAAGVQRSIAARAAAMAGGTVTEPVVFTGGVALVPGMRSALEEAFGCPVALAPEPQLTGALGAAILAATRFGS